MIVQGSDGGLLLFRQTDHALLSGAYADAWAWPFERRARTIVAAARHDDGWADWELAPKVTNEGRPIDFIGVPVREHVVIYRRGIDLVEAEDPYAGCVVSLHGERLYTRPFHPGTQARMDYLTGDALDYAKRYVDYEVERQRRLAGEVAASEGASADALGAALEEAWRLMQVWDRLSLFVCMQPLGSGASATMPPLRGPGGEDVTIQVRSLRAGAIELEPYPFTEPGARFEIEAFEVEGERWENEESFRRAYRGARRRVVTFGAG